MKKYTVENLVEILVQNGKCKEEERGVVLYGLRMAREIIANIITTIVIGLLFGMMLETIVFSVTFAILRSYCGGVHARNGLECYIFSSITLVMVLLIQKFDVIVGDVASVVMLIGAAMILMFAPIGDYNKRLDTIERQVYRNKVQLILIGYILLYLVGVFLELEWLAISTSLAIFVVGISLLLGKIKNRMNH
ncbi:MAG: accessory gene regulator B family protein [Eubacteriales bacterium]